MDFNFSENAESDLDKIINYISKTLFNKQAAKDFFQEISKIIEDIKLFPEMYELVNNEFIKNKKIRRAPVQNYNLYYVYNDTTNSLTVLRILYAHQNLESKFGETTEVDS